MTLKESMKTLKEYARQVGCPVKIIGDYAYQSKGGHRIIRLKRSRQGAGWVEVYDSRYNYLILLY